MPEPNKHRKRWYRPRNVVLTVLFAIVLVIGWICLDGWRVYTDAPESTDEYRAEMMALCAAGQPEGEDGWPLLAGVLEQLDSAAEDARRPLWQSGDWDRADEAGHAAMEAALDELGLLDELRRALALPRFVRPWTTEGLLMNELLPLTSPTRRLSKNLTQRMRNAAERGNWTETLDLMRLTIQLGDVTARQPTTIHAMTGASIQRRALRTVRDIFNERAVPSEVSVEIAALVAIVDDPAVAQQLEIERLATQNILHWTHGSRGYALPLTTLFDAGVVSGGLVAMSPVDPANDDRSLLRAGVARWYLASRGECGALADQWYVVLKAQAKQPFATRWDGWPPQKLMTAIQSPKHALLAYFLPGLERLVDGADALIVERTATHLMSAIEQYQAIQTRPPASLGDLVPEWIESVPTDPIHGGPFGYKLLTDDPAGRSYLLYSFGADGVDNGGLFHDDGHGIASYRVDDGSDVPLN
ncbi:MAG: hypothetical protein IH830_09100 [Planctomycetes bacterium]|nr:hypothetical protein [Planctomycetota bacterium]